jgi:hypothetical protein
MYILIGSVLAVTMNRVGLMPSSGAMSVLMGFYVGIMLIALLEGKGWLAMYYLAAMLIIVAVMGMQKR